MQPSVQITAAQDDGLITSGEAKRLAGGISDMTVWRWIRAGIIPSPLKIRGRNYWRRSEFVRSLEAAAYPTTTGESSVMEGTS